MAEEVFDRAGEHLKTVAPTTIYQAPSSSPSDCAVIMDCTIAHVVPGGLPAGVKVSALSADGQSSRMLSRRKAIYPRSAFRMLSGKAILKAGERLQVTAERPGVLDVAVSVMAQYALPGNSAIPGVEVQVLFPAPAGVGAISDTQPGALALTVSFPAPAVAVHTSITPPALSVVASFPAPSAP